MSSASPILLNPPPPPQTPNIFSLLPTSPFSLYTPHRRRPQSLTLTQTLTLLRKPSSLSPPPPLSSSFQFSPHQQQQQQTSIDDDEEEEHIIGDCLVFEEGAFEDPYLHQSFDSNPNKPQTKNGKASSVEIEPENLIPDKWKNVQAEINITKKQRRKIAQELEFGRRVDRKRKGLVPIRDVNLGDYVAYRDSKLSQLKPLVLDSPSFSENNEGANDGKDVNESSDGDGNPSTSSRVAPRNPRLAVYGGTLEDVSEFFSSGNYDPNAAKSEGPRKLFTKEEKVMLNRRVPDLTVAASGKWIPLHSLAASGEFYLVNTLLKHNVDINVQDNDGLTALHKSILCKKQAIFNYLLRESANPFVRDKDGATLMHYAVGTASSQMIKILLLYNVDINLQDNDGWTPLHLAVQTRRTDLVRLLLIKGADKTLENGDGLTPLDLCLYSGQDTRTYELIKLIKQLCKSN